MPQCNLEGHFLAVLQTMPSTVKMHAQQQQMMAEAAESLPQQMTT